MLADLVVADGELLTEAQVFGHYAAPTTAPAGCKIDACTFIEHDYNDLAR